MISDQDEDDSDGLEKVNGKVREMIETFLKQIHERDECIDKEKSALSQFISVLDKNDNSESPRKLKATDFEFLNKRLNKLISD